MRLTRALLFTIASIIVLINPEVMVNGGEVNGQNPGKHLDPSCFCIGVTKPACGAAWNGTIQYVLSGKVVKIENDYPSPNKLVVLRIDEMFKGHRAGATEFSIHVHAARCSPYVFLNPFSEGERYFVYASGDERTREGYVSACNRVLPLADAEDDIRYWHELARAPHTGSVFGTIKKYTRKRENAGMHAYQEQNIYEIEPLQDRTVQAVGAGGAYFGRTDVEGRYQIDVPPGTYHVAVDQLQHSVRVRVVVPTKGCAEADFRQQLDGQMRTGGIGIEPARPPRMLGASGKMGKGN